MFSNTHFRSEKDKQIYSHPWTCFRSSVRYSLLGTFLNELGTFSSSFIYLPGPSSIEMILFYQGCVWSSWEMTLSVVKAMSDQVERISWEATFLNQLWEFKKTIRCAVNMARSSSIHHLHGPQVYSHVKIQ